MSTLSLNSLSSVPVATTTDQVFDVLYSAIVSFQLPPGTKLSESDVAAQFNVSRQPVRDAFFRLSELGFLLIRPQRATLITKISEEAVQQASFVRTALELACLQDAMQQMSDANLTRLDDILAQQKQAVEAEDRAAFHELDDGFHRTLCDIAGRSHVWVLIKEHKAHMDRVRFLSLPFSLDIAYGEHQGIMEAIRSGDKMKANVLMRNHLERIISILGQIRNDNTEYFEDLQG